VPLEEVFRKIHEKYGDKALPVDGKSETPALHGFMSEILPNYDQDRVYSSDMKKLVTWYTLLVNHLPEFFEGTGEEVQAEAEEPVAEEEKTAEEPKAGKKASKK
jgi:hypothetical protein